MSVIEGVEFAKSECLGYREEKQLTYKEAFDMYGITDGGCVIDLNQDRKSKEACQQLDELPQMRWRFVRDFADEWYMIPADRYEEFIKWDTVCRDDTVFEDFRIGMDIEGITFTNPIKL